MWGIYFVVEDVRDATWGNSCLVPRSTVVRVVFRRLLLYYTQKRAHELGF